jgi:NAD(P)-dependent dehydrogenase (short-subunit alcohol dehydrogenase family)
MPAQIPMMNATANTNSTEPTIQNYAVHADAAEAVVAEIATAGGRAIAVAADVANSAAVEAIVARAEADLGCSSNASSWPRSRHR